MISQLIIYVQSFPEFQHIACHQFRMMNNSSIIEYLRINRESRYALATINPSFAIISCTVPFQAVVATGIAVSHLSGPELPGEGLAPRGYRVKRWKNKNTFQCHQRWHIIKIIIKHSQRKEHIYCPNVIWNLTIVLAISDHSKSSSV